MLDNPKCVPFPRRTRMRAFVFGTLAVGGRWGFMVLRAESRCGQKTTELRLREIDWLLDWRLRSRICLTWSLHIKQLIVKCYRFSSVLRCLVHLHSGWNGEFFSSSYMDSLSTWFRIHYETSVYGLAKLSTIKRLDLIQSSSPSVSVLRQWYLFHSRP